MSDIKNERRKLQLEIEKSVEKDRLKQKEVNKELKFRTDEMAELMEERRLVLLDISDLELIKGNISQEITDSHRDLWDVKKEEGKFMLSLKTQTKAALDKEKSLEQEYSVRFAELSIRRDNLDSMVKLVEAKNKRVRTLNCELDDKLEGLDQKQRQIEASIDEHKESAEKARVETRLLEAATKALRIVGDKVKASEDTLVEQREKLHKAVSKVAKQKEDHDAKVKNLQDRELELKLRTATVDKRENRINKLVELKELEA